jgi:hypothetical protein
VDDEVLGEDGWFVVEVMVPQLRLLAPGRVGHVSLWRRP